MGSAKINTLVAAPTENCSTSEERDALLDTGIGAIPAILQGILMATYGQHRYSLRWQAVGSGFCERSSSLMLSRRPLVDTKFTFPSSYFDIKSLFRQTKSISGPLELSRASVNQ
jgi:hypothetical protein